MDFESAVLEAEPLTDDGKSRARATVLAGVAGVERRRRRNVVRGSVAAAAAVMAGVVTYPLLFPASAYASWTAIPRPVTISADDPRLGQCTSSVPSGPTDSVGSALQLRPVVTEQRGDFTAALLGGGDSIAVCIFDDTNRSAGRTIAVALPAGSSVSLIGNGGSLDEGEGARYVYGRVAAGVEKVKVVTTEGVEVTASVADGYYLAWWPAPAGPATVTAFGRDGAVLQKLIAS
ncbi:hypothetical protein [Kribbella sp. CA-293567]|uniref:hypothetical protein n=1 Tax=Kribbella sp. CA-293567 TaxID=3002436 RepID=UPI0022DE22C7|nr:hypothetical protein [Kribbella sp. CA-293567]WBQ03416.1 hypothetical protein OX958_26005 [Kribbella sp. CA-293567]